MNFKFDPKLRTAIKSDYTWVAGALAMAAATSISPASLVALAATSARLIVGRKMAKHDPELFRHALLRGKVDELTKSRFAFRILATVIPGFVAAAGLLTFSGVQFYNRLNSTQSDLFNAAEKFAAMHIKTTHPQDVGPAPVGQDDFGQPSRNKVFVIDASTAFNQMPNPFDWKFYIGGSVSIHIGICAKVEFPARESRTSKDGMYRITSTFFNAGPLAPTIAYIDPTHLQDYRPGLDSSIQMKVKSSCNLS